jgi:hypothetical protein
LTWNSTEPNYYEFIPAASTKNGTSITIQITQKQLSWIKRAFNWLKSVLYFWKK